MDIFDRRGLKSWLRSEDGLDRLIERTDSFLLRSLPRMEHKAAIVGRRTVDCVEAAADADASGGSMVQVHRYLTLAARLGAAHLVSAQDLDTGYGLVVDGVEYPFERSFTSQTQASIFHYLANICLVLRASREVEVLLLVEPESIQKMNDVHLVAWLQSVLSGGLDPVVHGRAVEHFQNVAEGNHPWGIEVGQYKDAVYQPVVELYGFLLADDRVGFDVAFQRALDIHKEYFSDDAMRAQGWLSWGVLGAGAVAFDLKGWEPPVDHELAPAWLITGQYLNELNATLDQT